MWVGTVTGNYLVERCGQCHLWRQIAKGSEKKRGKFEEKKKRTKERKVEN
jgi:hypothetical protein